MKHIKISAFDCPDAWFKTLNTIWYEGDIFITEKGSELGETKKLNLSIEINNPNNRPLLDSKTPFDNNYLLTYFSQYLWLDDIKEESYTYSSRMRRPTDQIQSAIESLSKNPNNRQTTIVLRRPEDFSSNDPPCLTLIDLEILDNALHLTCYFRSWDAYAGLPANIAGLQLFNEEMVNEINTKSNLDLKTGKLIFHSKNCHIYKRQYPLVEKLLKPKKFVIKK